MKHNKRFASLFIIGLLLAAMVAASLLALAAVPAAPSEEALYSYVGTVALQEVCVGELDDQLCQDGASLAPEELPALGQIDLGFRIVESGQTITGHIDLEYTMVFTGEHQLDAVWFGPMVTGTVGSSSLQLASGPISLTSAGRRLIRQFSLDGGPVADQENAFTGEYRETLWGYANLPFTVVGTFTLQRAPYVAPPELPPIPSTVYLPVVVR